MSRDTVNLTVDGIALGGDGIGRTEEGRIVFVPGTAPGDRVRAELTDRRKRWARGRVLELYELGPGRVEPPCRYFGSCGGCRLMHLDRESQLTALRQGVVDVLARIGGVNVPVEAIGAGERVLGYRNRITLTVRRRRGRVFAGYHSTRGRRLVDVSECPLAEPPIQSAWKALREHWGAGARRLPPGGEVRVTLRATVAGSIGMYVAGGRTVPTREEEALRASSERLVEAVPGLGSVWWEPGDGDRIHLAGTRRLEDVWSGFRVKLLPRAFVQVNREVTGLLERHLDEGLGRLEGRRVVDLYAGIGLRGIRWSARGANVVSVEAEPDAVAAGRSVADGGSGGPDFVEARVEDVLPHGILSDADIVVVNPPRAGLDARVAATLAGGGAETLVYVSCDPATLARDVARLAPSWVPTRARPFDAFPQTGHVETVLWLERGTAQA